MLDFFSSIGSFIMTPLYYLVSAIMMGFHSVFDNVMGQGAAWILSIVGLTLVIRVALIPLFVKQIKSSRNMQLIQPQVKALQKKYGHDRERLAQETMSLYKETGTNPFASCMPILLQMPIFFALFRMIDHASDGDGKGFMDDAHAESFKTAKLFGVPIRLTLIGNDGNHGVIVMALVLVVAMTITTFLTQRQLMSKNMPADALSGQYAQQQKMLLYILPLVFAVGGIAFPIGVLVYWTTSNLWTMGQQFYVIRNNPAPGTPAAKAKEERDRAKAERKGEAYGEDSVIAEANEALESEKRPQQRQQPSKQTRSERKKKSGGGSGGNQKQAKKPNNT